MPLEMKNYEVATAVGHEGLSFDVRYGFFLIQAEKKAMVQMKSISITPDGQVACGQQACDCFEGRRLRHGWHWWHAG